MNPAPRRAVLLESEAPWVSHFTRGLLRGAAATGWATTLIWLRERRGAPRPLATLQREVAAARPDRIVFLMDAPLPWPELWEGPEGVAAPKHALWFDDFRRSPHTLAHPDRWARWQFHHGVQVSIWDGFWRARWRELTGASAAPIHLGVDPADFAPPSPRPAPDPERRIAFVGTVPSAAALERSLAALPAMVAQTARTWLCGLGSAPWPLRPYDLWAQAVESAPARLRTALLGWQAHPTHDAVLHDFLWRAGKRAARLRGLAAAGRAAPLLVLSGHGREEHAREAELRAALPGVDLRWADTNGLDPAHFGQLYAQGQAHLQITDPQSIEGGLPFRVFECAAAGRMLISDHRPELEDLFGRWLAGALPKDESGITAAVARVRSLPPEELDATAAGWREEVRARHTWAHRWTALVETSVRAAQAA